METIDLFYIQIINWPIKSILRNIKIYLLWCLVFIHLLAEYFIKQISQDSHFLGSRSGHSNKTHSLPLSFISACVIPELVSVVIEVSMGCYESLAKKQVP